MDPRNTNLGGVQGIIQYPQRRSSRIANARGAMARITIGLTQEIVKSFLLRCTYIRAERRKVASDGGFRHQVLQETAVTRAERTTVVVLRNPINTSAIRKRRDHAESTYVVISDPALESRIPALKIPCGESPLSLCEEDAKA